MPTPAYIIAVDHQLEDKLSNRVSLINVVENVVVAFDSERLAAHVPKEQQELAKKAILNQIDVDIAIISVWLFEESDYGEYENEIAFQQDGVDLSPPASLPRIKIAENAPTFHRVRVNLGGLPPVKHSGVWKVINRIRREGEPWTSQECPLLVTANDEFFALLDEAKVDLKSIQRHSGPE